MTHHVARRVEHMTRYGAPARLLATTIACVLAANSLHAQVSPNRGWALLKFQAERAVAGRYPYRVTVRTAAGKATGDLRAVEPDRLMFGDRRGHLMIRARGEICDVFKSKYSLRPRGEVLSIALAGALMWLGLGWLAKGEAKRAR